MVTKRSPKPAPRRPATKRKLPKREVTIFEKIVERGKRIPDDELARHPVDGAANLEHYLYGVPKQDPD